MNLLVSRHAHKDDYDDSSERDTWKKFCAQVKYEVIFNDKYSSVDCIVRKVPDGKFIAIELARNSCWTTQEEYPEEYIHIPYRKFKYFQQVINGVPIGCPDADVAKCDKGYFVLFNSLHTKMAFLNFETLITNVKEFKINKLTLNNEVCKVLLVPKKFIAFYKNIL